MAVPTSMTSLDLSGTFTLNKSLSDTAAMDRILGQQGVGWLLRKAAAAATLTLHIRHYTDGADVEHIDITQHLPRDRTVAELRTLDGTEHANESRALGHVLSSTRRMRLVDVSEEWLRNGWTQDAVEHGVIEVLTCSETAKSKTTWELRSTWGFEVVEGQQRYTRHVLFTGPKGEVIKARMTYDYHGPCP